MRNPFSYVIDSWLLTYIALLGGLCLSGLYIHYVAHQNVPGFVRIPRKSDFGPVIVSAQDRCTNVLTYMCPFGTPECDSKFYHSRGLKY